MRVDEVKAAQHGIAVQDVAHALALATSGMQVGLLNDKTVREPVPTVVELDRADRSSEQGLENIRLPGAEISLATALLRAWMASERQAPKQRSWLRKICPICLAMIESAMPPEDVSRPCIQ